MHIVNILPKTAKDGLAFCEEAIAMSARLQNSETDIKGSLKYYRHMTSINPDMPLANAIRLICIEKRDATWLSMKYGT